MNYSDQSSVTKQGSRKFARSPLAVTAAALIAVGAWGFALGQDMRFASAEPAQSAQSVQAPPLGAAPLSFADLVQTVSPAVVSINVKGESEVADNDMQIPGLPDLPRTTPSTTSSSSPPGPSQKPRWAPGSSASDHSPRLGLLHFA